MKPRSLVLATALGVLVAPGAFAQTTPPRLDAHYLNPAQEYLVAGEEYQGGYIYVTLATMLQGPTEATQGEAQFVSLGGQRGAGERFWSRFYWKTRTATPADIALGRIVFVLNATDAQGVYRAPQGRTDAVQTGWFMGTIVDVSELFRQRVLVDAYTANLNGLRIPVDPPGPAAIATPPAQLDAQFIDSADYFTADDEFSGSGFINLTLARLITPATPETGGEAQFLSLSGGSHRSGSRFWTRWFWRTRPARPDELTVGKTVICFNATAPDGTYRAPQNRKEAVETNWWMANVADLSLAHRQVVQAGDYRVNINGMRVVR
jgi:hypothetical protein